MYIHVCTRRNCCVYEITMDNILRFDSCVENYNKGRRDHHEPGIVASEPPVGGLSHPMLPYKTKVGKMNKSYNMEDIHVIYLS